MSDEQMIRMAAFDHARQLREKVGDSDLDGILADAKRIAAYLEAGTDIKD